MRADEAYTYTEYASLSAYDSISKYTFPNNHLFHTLLVHFTTKYFGSASWAIRLPALIAGIGLIPASFTMVQRLTNVRAGLWAAALVASSNPLISYSANARGYSMTCLFTVLIVISADRIVARDQVIDWCCFVALAALGLFTIPIMIYPVAGVVSWILYRRFSGTKRKPRIDRLFLAILACGFLTIALYLPTILRFGVEAVASNRFVKPRSFEDFRRELPGSLIQVWEQWNVDIPRPIALGFVVIWLASLIVPSAGRTGVRAITFLFFAVFASALAVVFCQRVVPFDRVWLFLAPVYLGMIGASLAALVEWMVGSQSRWHLLLPLIITVVLGLLVWKSDSIPAETAKLTLNHHERVIKRLLDEFKPSDAVIAQVPCDAPLRYYMMVNGLPVDALFDYRVARAKRVFVVVSRPNEQTVKSVLDANGFVMLPGFEPVLVEDFGRSVLYTLSR